MSAAIAFSAVAGYLFCNKSFDWTVLAVFAGVLLLAGSATALNQFQERNQDALMERTRDRPLPTGEITPGSALLLSAIMGICGLVILYFLTTPLTALLGVANILWYNGVYTPLKRKTGFVVIIGAVTGALPPMMGWTAAGGSLADRGIIFIATFFFLWQIPHFLLLLLKYKEDYERAGFVSATTTMNDGQIKSIVFAWVLGTSMITLFFPVFGIISGRFLIICTVVLNGLLIASFYRMTFNKKRNISGPVPAFNMGSLYLYQLSILAILMMQALK
jgi:protoheme IX farnesyltransferase